MRGITPFLACVLIVLLAHSPLHAQAVAGPEIWSAFIQKIEPGRMLKVRLKNGQRFNATLLQASSGAMTVQPQTRTSVPPQRVPFDAIETLEIAHGRGIGVGKAVAIGAGVAAGVWLALMALTFAFLGD